MSQLDDRLRAGLSTLVDDVSPTRTPDEVLAALRARPQLLAAVPSSPRPHRRRAIAAVAAFVVVVLGVAALVLSRDRSEQPAHVDVTPSTNPTGSWDPRSLGSGWHDLPPGPFDGVSPTAMVWTGSELILWHGSHVADNTQTDATASYEPATQKWTSLGPNPLVGRGIEEGAGPGRDRSDVLVRLGGCALEPGDTVVAIGGPDHRAHVERGGVGRRAAADVAGRPRLRPCGRRVDELRPAPGAVRRRPLRAHCDLDRLGAGGGE